MSQEDVETLRRAVEYGNAHGPEEAIDAMAGLYHPDAEAHDLQPGPDMAAVQQGRDAIVKVWRQWSDVLDDWRVEVHEYVDADPWVICDVHWHAIGKGSNVPIDWRVAEAHKFEGGKIVRSLWGYANVAEALEAVGPSEQDAHADS